MPPDTSMTAPLAHWKASERIAATADPISSGRPGRPSEVIDEIADRERYPTADLAEIENAIVRATVSTMAEHLGISLEEATLKFEDLSLKEKRSAANTSLTVTLAPGVPTGGLLTLERRVR